jgi:mRNA-degrading endonuclease toxin of MazEF toxin-antitoxin module
VLTSGTALPGFPEPPRQWHVYWVDLGSRGRGRPGKVRPCLVIQPSSDGRRLGTTVVLPLTTRIAAEGAFPVRIRLPDGTCGLRARSDVMVDQIFASDNRLFRADLGAVPPAVQIAVRHALFDFLDLGEAA